MIKVKMPKWWTDVNHDVYGYTDAVDTYCCDLQAAWFVEVPEFEYSGYFQAKDLVIV